MKNMSDLRLITILPPQPVAGIQQPQVAGGQSQQIGIASLPVGSIVTGFIINRDSSGNPILRTETGDIAFSGNFFLKIGSEVTIRIEHIAGNNQAHILSVDGLPPEVAATRSSFADEPDFIIGRGEQQQKTSKIPGGENIPIENIYLKSTPQLTQVKGTIIPVVIPAAASAQESSPPAASQNLAAGTGLLLKIINLSSPLAPPSAQPQTAGEENIPTNNPAPSSSAPHPSSLAASSPYAAYNRSTYSQQQTQQPSETVTTQPTTNTTVQSQTSTSPQQISTATIGKQIEATVIDRLQNGVTTLASELGNIRLQTPLTLPLGSKITFEISETISPEQNTPDKKAPEISNRNLSSSIITNTSSAAPAAPTSLAETIRGSGALSNIFTVLAASNLPDAVNFLQTIPQLNLGQKIISNHQSQANPEHNFLAAIFGFSQAAKGGDLRAWLGKNNVRLLENKGYEELLKKAEAEFSAISKGFTDIPEKQWQSLIFPVAIDDNLHTARLFVKRERKEKEKNGRKEQEEDVRFVMEIALSSLGAMQMDGFVRRDNDNVRFDLVIRSHTELPAEIQKDILNIYNNTGELTGYSGNIIFQHTELFPVNPLEELMQDKHKAIIV